MARVVKDKILKNTRLATNYGGWMYCDVCQENIGYLCYATYDAIILKYCCQCGSQGEVRIDFEDSQPGEPCNDELTLIKNRFCCSDDQSPLITLIDKKLTGYDLEITCKACHKIYKKEKKL